MIQICTVAFSGVTCCSKRLV